MEQIINKAVNREVLTQAVALSYVNHCWDVLARYYFYTNYKRLSSKYAEFISINWGQTIKHEIFDLKSHVANKNIGQFKLYFKNKYTLRMKLIQLPEDVC